MKVKVKSKKGSVKLFLRNALIRHAKVFGSRIPTLLDKISYLIKCSQFFSVKTKLFSYRKDMYRHIIEQYKLSRKDINYLEYGVYAGGTIRWWSEKNGSKNSTFIGFDSFEGLPETWGGNFEKGTYDTGGQIPDINDERVIFKAGWFNDTLPKWRYPDFCVNGIFILF